METIFEIEGTVTLETTDSVYAFMKQLLNYELFISRKEHNFGLENPPDGPTFRLARPFIEEGLSREQMREFAWAIGVDSTFRALYVELLSIGNIHRTMASAWQAYRGTAYYGACAIFIVHNHVSGDPKPTPEDIAFTKDAIEGGIRLGRTLMDHIIMGKDSYYSFNDNLESLRHEVVEDIKERIKLRKDINEAKKELAEQEIELAKAQVLNIEKDRRIAELEAKLKGMEA